MIEQPPKVFISYSYDSPEHKEWVEGLARRLRDKRIDAILDKWHFKLGKPSAMDMNDAIAKSDRVLCICTDQYIERVDQGKGGAGYEGCLITAELVRDSSTEKFIPVIRNVTGTQKTPKCLDGRNRVDLSDGERCEEEFERLLRHLHNAIEIPPLGPDPFLQPLSKTASTRHSTAHTALEQKENGPRDYAVDDESFSGVEKIRSEFHEAIRSNRFGNLDSNDGVLAITIIPVNRRATAIDLSVKEALLREKLEPLCASGNNYRRDSRFFGTVSTGSDGKIYDATEFTDRGIIFAANRRVLVEDSGHYRQKQDGELIRSIYLSKIESVSVRAITSYFTLLEELRISLPWCVDISLINLRPSILLSSEILVHMSGQKVFKDKDIIPDLIRIQEVLSEQAEVARSLRPAFNFLWRAFGFRGSPYYRASGEWYMIGR